MMSSRLLVTGASGYLGRHLASLLRAEEPYAVLTGIDRLNSGQGCPPVPVDLNERSAIEDLLAARQPEVIFHMAGVIAGAGFDELYHGNVTITVNLLEAVRRCCPTARVVIPGSAAEYGRVSPAMLPLREDSPLNPVSPYGVAKVWQTTVARYFAEQGVDVCVGRIFNLLGPGIPEYLSIGTFSSQLHRIHRGELPPRLSAGNLLARRDFIDVEDACRGLLALARFGKRNGIYNICSGMSVSLREIVAMLIRESGLSVTVETDPARLKGSDIDDIVGSYAKLTADTGWVPRLSLTESIERLTREIRG